MAYNPPIGSIYHLYTTHILPSGGLYATYHLLREPETTIDIILLFLYRDDKLLSFKFGILYYSKAEKTIVTCFLFFLRSTFPIQESKFLAAFYVFECFYLRIRKGQPQEERIGPKGFAIDPWRGSHLKRAGSCHRS